MKNVYINGVPFKSSSTKLVRQPDNPNLGQSSSNASQPQFVRTRNGLINVNSPAYKNQFNKTSEADIIKKNTIPLSSSSSTSTNTTSAVTTDLDKESQVRKAELEHARQIELNKQRRKRLDAFLQNLKERRDRKRSIHMPYTKTRPPQTKKMMKDKPCKFYQWTGTCKNGLTCRYKHNPDKVPLCPKFLSGKCSESDASCKYSHVANAHRTPHCSHFPRCSRENCPYPHVGLSPDAPVCADFAKYGYCERGIDCPERHIFECPRFTATGECKVPRCRLPHIIHGKASTNKKNNDEPKSKQIDLPVRESAFSSDDSDNSDDENNNDADLTAVSEAQEQMLTDHIDTASSMPQTLTMADLKAMQNEAQSRKIVSASPKRDWLADNADFVTLDSESDEDSDEEA